MHAISDYIKIVTTLLGIAYPILFQVVARLDEKYSSNLIVELFDKEYSKKAFKSLLISSLISILIWSLELPSLVNIGKLNFVIDNSAGIIVIVNTTLLVIAFFYFVNRILIYYTPSKFINYLMKKHDRSDINLLYFKALTDILLSSIKKNNTTNSATISRFFYSAFKTERESTNNKPVEYPDCYYTLVYYTIEELALLKNQKNLALEERTSGGIWLLGELQHSEISEATYTWLWRNILLALKYENDDMIMAFWRNAHQYFSLNLKYLQYEYNNQFEIINAEAIEKRKKERTIFLEFLYALGGLLLYKKRYSCLKRIFNYSTSTPPNYVLLPLSMNEIFSMYNEFRDPYEYKYPWISSKFPFPDLDGFDSSQIIKNWISTYCALLMLRQYFIVPYLSSMRPLDYPTLPVTQTERTKWIEGMDYFKRLILGLLSNSQMLSILEYELLTEEWCLTNHIIYPPTFIDNLKSKLEIAYSHGELNLEISRDKVLNFYNSTKIAYEETLNNYSILHNPLVSQSENNKWYVNGQKIIQRKDVFTENPEVDHLNFDSILGEILCNNIVNGIGSTFMMSKSKSYLLTPKDIFHGIDKLELGDTHLLINFGINLENYISVHKVNELTNEQYKGVTIINLPISQFTRQSIFALRKTDLPNVTTLEIDDTTIRKYSLEKISGDYNIYTSVIDLNLSTDELRTENSQSYSDLELRKSVLMTAAQSLEIQWMKNVDLIEFIEYSEYREMGMPNKLDEISKLESD